MTARSITTSLAAAALVWAVLAHTSAQADDVLAQGSFEGRSDHVVTGNASIVATGDGGIVRLTDDFSLDGAPDPKVAIGTGGQKPTLILAPLAANNGTQDYALPVDVTAEGITQVWIWCEAYDVPLGYAELK